MYHPSLAAKRHLDHVSTTKQILVGKARKVVDVVEGVFSSLCCAVFSS